MATDSTFKIAKERAQARVAGSSYMEQRVTFASDQANNGDDIEFMELPANSIIKNAWIEQESGLGTSVTLTLKAGSKSLTAATTSGSASVKTMDNNNVFPVDVGTSNQQIKATVGGGDIASSANVNVAVEYEVREA